MDPKLIQATLQFMQRVQLQGGEVPAFVACMNALNQLAQEQQQAHAIMNGQGMPPPAMREAAE